MNTMLTERELQVMDLFNKSLLQNQIARELKISNGRVAQIINAASRKLYRYYICTYEQCGIQPTANLVTDDKETPSH